MSLNVLHISESDAHGGAAKAARSLHEGLGELGFDSKMIVGRKLSPDPKTRALKRNLAWRVADRPFGLLAEWLDLQYAFFPSSFGVIRDRWWGEADVLQLHNLHGSYFGYTALPVLTRRLPTVWWIQDMWPVTGHVAYSFGCERWRRGCGECPYLESYPRLSRDTTALLWKLKKSVYSRSLLTLVVSSHWLESVIAESPLLSHFERRIIPNGIDTGFFAPHARQAALDVLGIDAEPPILLCFDGEERKGSRFLPAIVERLAAAGVEATMLVAGESGDWDAPPPVRVVRLGRLTDERALRAAYVAADVFLLPTLADNLPNSVIESLACGTPVVATSVGGIPDAVRHLETGYLAAPESIEDIARGAALLLSDPELTARLGAAARETALARYDRSVQTRAFVELYEEVLGRERARTD